MAYVDPFADPEFRKRMSTPTVAPEEKTGSKGGASDLLYSYGAGAGGLVGSTGTFLFGSDSAMTELGQSATEYWDAKKSDELKAKEAALSEQIADGNYGQSAGYVITNPGLAANLLMGSAPSMAIGMGIGGLVGRAMLKGGLMVNEAGQLTRTGSALAAGIGEGAVMAPEAYVNTQGNAGTAGAAMLLGVATNLLSPVNVGTAAVRKITGATESATGAMARSGFGGAALRTGTTMGGEFTQELTQETGQPLLEQAGRGEDLNYGSALARGTVGGVLGANTALALHPITGGGSKLAELNRATKIMQEIEAAGGDASTANALVNKLSAEVAIIDSGKPATEEQLALLKVTEAKLVAARNPDNREASLIADTAEAEYLANLPKAAQAEAVDIATSAASDAILASGTLSESLEAFGAHNQASSIGRIGVEAVTRTAQAVADVTTDTLVSANYVDPASLSEAERKNYNAPEEFSDEQMRQIEQEHKATREALKTEQQAAKVEQIKLATREKFNDKIDTHAAIAADPATAPQVRAIAAERVTQLTAERDSLLPAPAAIAPELGQPATAVPAQVEAAVAAEPVVQGDLGTDVLPAPYITPPAAAPELAVGPAAADQGAVMPAAPLPTTAAQTEAAVTRARIPIAERISAVPDSLKIKLGKKNVNARKAMLRIEQRVERFEALRKCLG